MLVGKPKAGKSFMALDLAVAVSSGGQFLGRICEQGDVLGLFLEDNERRIQRRLTSMIGARMSDWPPRLICATEWPKLAEGGLDEIRKWCQSVEKPRLVIVDILEMVRSHAGKTSTQYTSDYEALKELQKLAGDMKISILVLHHQRKAAADNLLDTISGTGGLGGGSDAVIILGEDGAGHFLWGKGREIDSFRIIVKMENFRWRDLGEKPESKGSGQRLRIIALLASSVRPMKVSEITAALPDQQAVNIKNLLPDMYRDGEIASPARGVYASLQWKPEPLGTNRAML